MAVLSLQALPIADMKMTFIRYVIGALLALDSKLRRHFLPIEFVL
jgi:hypothetical protein